MNTSVQQYTSHPIPTIKKLRAAITVVATAAALMLGAHSAALADHHGAKAPTAKEETITFALDFLPDGLHAPVYAAQAKDFTGSTKLEIEPGNGSSLTIKLVAAGQAEMGIADAGSVSTAVEKGANVTAVALLLKHTPAITLVSAESGAKTVSDLRGKSIGDFPEASTAVLLPAVLKANGLSENDIKFVGMNFSARVPALQTGKVDGVNGYIQEFVTLPDSLTRIVWAENNFNIYGPVLIVNNDFAKQHPNRVKEVLAGFVKGLEYTNANPREVAEIIAKASRGDADFFEKELEVLESFFAAPDAINMTPEGWEAVQKVMMEYGGQAKKVDDANLYTNEFIKAK